MISSTNKEQAKELEVSKTFKNLENKIEDTNSSKVPTNTEIEQKQKDLPRENENNFENRIRAYFPNIESFTTESAKATIPNEKSGKPLYLTIKCIDKDSNDWQSYAMNFNKHSPEGFKAPNKIYVLEFRTTAQNSYDNLIMVGLISNQNAAYVGNIVAIEGSSWKAGDVLKKWDELLIHLSIKVVSLQDTAHLSVGDGNLGPIELTTRWYFPIIRSDENNFYQRLGYRFEGQTINLEEIETYITPERYQQAYKNLANTSISSIQNENQQKLLELHKESKIIHSKINDFTNTSFNMTNLELKETLKKNNQTINERIREIESYQSLLETYEALLKIDPNKQLNMKSLMTLMTEISRNEDLKFAKIKSYLKNRNVNEDLSILLYEFIALNPSEDAQIVNKCDEFHKYYATVEK